MLIHSASQLLTLSGGPQRGEELGRLGAIEDGAVLVRNDKIEAVARTSDLLKAYPNEPRYDARGRVVMPGFVDPHTHAVWIGDRANEFEMRLAGKSYMEIMATGGGIVSTVRSVRQASVEQMMDETRRRLAAMFAHGTTTAEVKTGYGLETDSEIRQLDAVYRLNAEGPLELAATFLGAHAIPEEFKQDPDGFTELVIKEMLPAVKAWHEQSVSDQTVPFCDVFCEKGAFTLAQSRAILTAASDLGFPLKIHADEFENLGGASLAAELGAASADHLVKTSSEDIARLGAGSTVAVALPCTPFGLAERDYTPAKEILAAGGLLAIATDINPGTAWCESMQFVLALACRYLRLTPGQAIAAATINAAAAINRSDSIGSLEPGKQADLLILSVDDYRMLGYRFGTNLVDTVVKRGQFYPVKETRGSV